MEQNNGSAPNNTGLPLTPKIDAGVNTHFAGFLATIVQAANVGLWDWDLATGHVVYSPQWEAIAGYTPGTLAQNSTTWQNLLLPDDFSNASTAVQAYLDGSASSYEVEFRMRHKNGSILWAQDKGVITQRDANGKPVRLAGLLQDITHIKKTDKLKRAEQKLQIALLENERHNENLKIEVQHVTNQLRQSLQHGQAMLQANPYPSLICDDTFHVFDCNPAAVAFFGFSSKNSFLEAFSSFIHRATPALQPNGNTSIPLEKRLAYVKIHGYLEFETVLQINNVPRPIQVVLKRLEYNSSFAIAAYLIDLASIKQAKTELLRQDKLLHEVNTVATKLLSVEPAKFSQVVQNCLQILGKSVDVTRMYIWRIYNQDGQMRCHKLFEWCNTGVARQEADFAADYYTANAPHFMKNMLAQKCVNTPVKFLSREEQNLFTPLGVLSILVIPIYWQGNFWGFIGFDDCQQERFFSEIEEKVLESGSILIVSGILRNESTSNLMQAKEAALESAKTKSEFLSRMSHEIRTPMNAIIGMTTIAKKTDDATKIQHCLHTIDTSSKQLLGIINDVLDMSKIEANKLEIVPVEFDFEKMMQHIFDIIQVKVDEKQQHFRVHFKNIFTRNVISDELRLVQVLTNLLINAVKFTPEKGKITLTISYTPITDDAATLHIEVQDSGIGISKQQQKRLFNSFEQADNSISRRFGGTGLGLAICKSIVTQMGGTIWVQSALHHGAVFVFEIPIQWGRACQATIPQHAPHKNLRILVADDSADVLVYFQNILQSFDIQCDIASSGKAAIDMVEQSIANSCPYDIIFIDWNMPGLNGLQTAAKLKEISNNATIVIISVADWSEVEAEAKQVGITHFLSKPILPSILYNSIIELTSFKGIPKPVPPPDDPVQFKGKTILVAEDIDINREIILTILEDTNASIQCAHNGTQAVALFESNNTQIDVILMDVQMPEMDGLMATRAIRQSKLPYAKSVPILAMTANALKEDVEECLRAGMNDHIAKPIDVNNLLNKLSHYLGVS